MSKLTWACKKVQFNAVDFYCLPIHHMVGGQQGKGSTKLALVLSPQCMVKISTGLNCYALSFTLLHYTALDYTALHGSLFQGSGLS